MHIDEQKRAVLRFLKLLSRILPMVFWVLLIFGFDEIYIAVLTLICVAVHELGHEAMLFAVSKRTKLPRVTSDGLRIDAGSFLSYGSELLLALSGPLANFLVFALAISFSSLSEYILSFAILNLITAISNLLPCEGMDGYCAINAVLCCTHASDCAFRVLSFVSLSVNILITLIALYLLQRCGEGYWIFGMFLSYTAVGLEKMRKRAFLENN